jgi:hypothetical protein
VYSRSPENLILQQLRKDFQVWKSSKKASKSVSTLTKVSFPDSLAPTPSTSSAVKTLDPQSPDGLSEYHVGTEEIQKT